MKLIEMLDVITNDQKVKVYGSYDSCYDGFAYKGEVDYPYNVKTNTPKVILKSDVIEVMIRRVGSEREQTMVIIVLLDGDADF